MNHGKTGTNTSVLGTYFSVLTVEPVYNEVLGKEPRYKETSF